MTSIRSSEPDGRPRGSVEYVTLVARRSQGSGGTTDNNRAGSDSSARDGARYAQQCIGSIAALVHDDAGDFEGFVLTTPHCEHTFFSREKPVEALAKRAGDERLPISVWVDHAEPQRPLAIMIRELG